MKRYAAIFGLFGFTAKLVLSILGEAPVFDVLKSSVLSGLAFAALGAGVGKALLLVISENERDRPDDRNDPEPTPSEEGARSEQVREPVIAER